MYVPQGPGKELPSDSRTQPSVWVRGEIIPFILALVCLITSLAVLRMAATGVRLRDAGAKSWPRSLLVPDLYGWVFDTVRSCSQLQSLVLGMRDKVSCSVLIKDWKGSFSF